MQMGTQCRICERDISSPSPKRDDDRQRLNDEWYGEDHIPVEPEAITSLGDGTPVHEACQKVYDFLHSLGTPPTTIERRLRGYVAGKTFAAYMNFGHGSESPAFNSYRVLMAGYIAMRNFEELWQSGQVVHPKRFTALLSKWPITPDAHDFAIEIEDLDFEEERRLVAYHRMAQVVLSYAVTMWKTAHKGGLPQHQQRRVAMYLDRSFYQGEQESAWAYFNDKRNSAIAHADKTSWDSRNTHLAYESYPDWAEDWQPFNALVMHGLYVCTVKIHEELELEPPREGELSWSGGNYNFDKVLSDFVRNFGLPHDLSSRSERTDAKPRKRYRIPLRPRRKA